MILDSRNANSKPKETYTKWNLDDKKLKTRLIKIAEI
jgi:hypothetical protein